ncbi:MAG: TIGR02270 family protein [Phycisphaerales bacterium]
MILATVITQHAEEAAFHWLLRDAAVCAPHYDLKDLAKLDDRVEAHIDGLRIAGAAGWEIVKEELGWQEAGEVFTAAILAFESGDAERIEEVLEVGVGEIELARGVISALGWMTYEQARPQIDSLLASDVPMRRRIGIAAAAIHRKDPGEALKAALVDDDAALRARALRAAGELGRRDVLSLVKGCVGHEDPGVRFWAAWSASVLGEMTAVLPLREIALGGGRSAERAADMAARRMPPVNALVWQKELSNDATRLRLAAKVAGAIGDPVLVPWLIEMMSNDEIARVAGEAFTMITGVDLAYDDLERDWPEGFEAGPTESPEDEDVSMDADEDLPWPDGNLISQWWNERGSDYAPGARHLLGKPMEVESLQDALKTGRQRQRAAASLELALRQPGQPLFEIRAPGYRQRAALPA